MSALGLLNFVVFQWFGVRLARVYAVEQRRGALVNAWVSGSGLSLGYAADRGRRVAIGWKLLRWVWPLTGWWSPFSWIARRT